MVISKFLKTLSNPKRLAVFQYISETCCHCDENKGLENGNCITSISKSLKLPQPTISNYVKSLIKNGLVSKVRKGKNIYLYTNKEAVDALILIQKIPL